jgi:hypothetical protein
MVGSTKKKNTSNVRAVSIAKPTAQSPTTTHIGLTNQNSLRNPLIFSSICIALLSALLAVWSYISRISTFDAGLRATQNWKKDDEFYKSSWSDNIGCDFPVILAKNFKKKNQKNMENLLDSPFIIRGLMTEWPAQYRWSKSNFSLEYGERVVKVGSESSIVYAGGTAASKSTLNAILEEMNNHGSKCSGDNCVDGNGTESIYGSDDSFTFDVSVLRSIPEMGRDFRVPGTRLFSFLLLSTLLVYTLLFYPVSIASVLQSHINLQLHCDLNNITT